MKTIKSLKKLNNIFNNRYLQGRSLTKNEIRTAKSVFGDEIDYKKVRVFYRPYFFLGPNNVSMAPNGNVYFLPHYAKFKDMCHDVQSRQLMIHELTHVWQHQKGINVKQAALKLFFRHSFQYSKAYKYKLDDNIDFQHLNIEQQASVVQHGYALKERFNHELNKSNPSCDLNALQRSIDKYNKIIRPHLPFS